MSLNNPPAQNGGRPVELRTGTPYANLIANQRRFAEAVGQRFGIEPDHVIPTTGATGAIEAVRNHVLKACVSRQPSVLTVTPGYWRARESFQGIGFRVIEVRTQADGFTFDEARLAESVREAQPDLVYLSLPNNPTGAVFDAAALVAQLPEQVALMLDLTLPSRDLNYGGLIGELYARFRGRKNLFLVGSTSKSHGTAEHRIGWAVCTSPEDAAQLRAENRSGVSSYSIAEGMSRLGEPPTVLEKIDESHSLLLAGADAGRYEVVRPARMVRSGYLLIKLSGDVEEARAALGARRISVMWGSEFGLTDEYIRLETIESESIRVFIEVINCARAEVAGAVES